MAILGLTGGSGTGKSTVASLLVARGAGWVDADAVYHTLCVSCEPMLAALVHEFGAVRRPNGALDRPALARIVFSDSAALTRLGELTAPYIRRASQDALHALSDRPIVLYDAPTLFESGADDLCDDVIGVLVPYDVRVARIIVRDGLTEAAARARIDAQPPDDFYRARCRYLIQNNDGLDALRPLVDALYEQIIR